MSTDKGASPDIQGTENGVPNDDPFTLGDIEALSPKHQALARYVAANPAFASFATAAELGQRVGASEATVVRFAQEIGFGSYKDFRHNLRARYLGTLTPLEEFGRRSDRGDAASTLRRQFLQDVNNLQASLDTIKEHDLERLLAAIAAARSIVVIGAGTYAMVAHVFAHALRYLGYQASSEDRSIANLTAALLPLDERDLVIGIGFWRVVRTTTEILAWAHQRGIPTAAITDTIYSPLASHADTSLVVSTESGSFYLSLVAPLSLVYSIVEHLALSADADRQRIIQDAIASFEVFKSSYA